MPCFSDKAPSLPINVQIALLYRAKPDLVPELLIMEWERSHVLDWVHEQESREEEDARRVSQTRPRSERR